MNIEYRLKLILGEDNFNRVLNRDFDKYFKGEFEELIEINPKLEKALVKRTVEEIYRNLIECKQLSNYLILN